VVLHHSQSYYADIGSSEHPILAGYFRSYSCIIGKYKANPFIVDKGWIDWQPCAIDK
jgi:hypothetical protein